MSSTANALSNLSILALQDILPSSIKDDDQIAAFSQGLDPNTRQIAIDTKQFLPYMACLDNLPSRIVDLLAWQFHVDNYDSSGDIATRRTLVREAIADHRLYGTRAAAKKQLDLVFGAGNYTLVEWWEADPPGDPFTFWVIIKTAFTQEMLQTAKQRMAVAANARSLWVGYIIWKNLDGISYTWNGLDALSLTWGKMDEFYFNAAVGG